MSWKITDTSDWSFLSMWVNPYQPMFRFTNNSVAKQYISKVAFKICSGKRGVTYRDSTTGAVAPCGENASNPKIRLCCTTDSRGEKNRKWSNLVTLEDNKPSIPITSLALYNSFAFAKCSYIVF